MLCLVGIDDTDSPRGFCTTYLGYRIARDLTDIIKVLPYPRLVRLNPNIPFKTRGNAAVCLPIETSDPDEAFAKISRKVEELSDVDRGANTGMVFLEEVTLGSEFKSLYLDALTGIVSPHRVRKMLSRLKVRRMELGNGMGLVGAAASLAFDESSDHTYELIAYRRSKNWGTRRMIDSTSVREMDGRTWPRTYNNYDYQKRKMLVAPHGPDPVLLGVRGDTPSTVLGAYASIDSDEEPAGHMIYLTNQHTDAHLADPLDWKAYSSGWVQGKVRDPEVGPGGHVYFELQARGSRIPCAAYEPTGDLRRTAKLLLDGDLVRAYGGVRRPSSSHSKILNVEKIEVRKLSGGRNRTLAKGTYIASPRANRHLTKPLSRYGREMAGTPSPAASGWLGPSPIETRVLA